MIYDSIDLLGNTKISNMTVDSGSSFPSNPSAGEIFFKTDDAQLFMYQGTEWVQITGEIAASTPKIASVVITDSSYNGIDDTAVDTAGGYVQILGSGFTEGASVLIGQTVINAQNVTYISSSELRAVIPARSAGTYSMYVVNIDGSVGVRINAITYSPFPAWSTSSSLSAGEEVNIQLSASENATYALAAGSTLPEGITLSASGLLSGTIQNHVVGTVYNFSVVATDAENQDVTRAFSINIIVGDPYFKSNVLLINTNDTAFTVDASPNAFELAVNGDVKANKFNPFTPGYYSAYFDGTGDFLTAPSSAAFGFGTGDFTVEFWAYRQSSTRQDWVDISNASPASRLLVYYTSSTVQVFANPPNSSIITGSNISDSVWTHIAVTRQSGSIRLFINGQQSGSTYTTSLNLGSTCSVTIGKDSSGTTHITGSISNLRIVKGTALYTDSFTPPTEPLTAVSGTSLLACQSARFIDNSANNFTITRNGDTLVASSHPFTLPSEYSELGSAYFDGNGDFLNTASSNAFTFGTNPFTIEAWVNPSVRAASVAQWIFSNLTTTSGNSQVGFIIMASGTLRLTTWSTLIVDSSSVTVPLNQWSHAAVTFDGTTYRLFINGINSGSSTTTFNLNLDGAGYISGAVPGGLSPFTGFISNLRVVKGTALYTSNFTPSSAPLTAVANTQLLALQNNKPATNNEFLDESPNNFPITRVGNTTQASFSPFGEDWSVYFDGTGDYLSFASNPAFAMGTGNFTVEGWVNYANRTNSGIFQISSTLFAGVTGLGLGLDAGLRWVLYHGANSQTAAATGASAGTWHHFAVVRNSGVTRVYIDGAATSINVSDTTNYTVSTLGIGGIYSGSFLLNGYISNFRIVKGTALYTSNFTPPSGKLRAVPGTVLLTCQSNRFVDNASNFTITPSGDARVTRFSPFTLGTLDTAPTSYSAYFDGSGDYLNLSGSEALAFGTGDFTVEFWLNIPFWNRGALIDFRPAGTNGSYFSVWMDGAGASLATLYVNSSNIIYSSQALPTNRWVHVAVTRQSGSTVLFIDGVQSGSTWADSTNYIVGAGRPTIGASGFGVNDGNIIGFISNLRIVKGTALYTNNFTPPTEPLTAVSGTSLLTCQDSTFRDNSSNNFTLTANGNVVPSTVNPFGGITAGNSQQYTPSVFGGSVYFDGSGDALTSTSQATIATGPFTIEAWVLPTTSGTWRSIVTNQSWQTGQNAGWISGLSNSNQIYLAASIGTRSTFPIIITSSTPVVAGSWQHVAVTRDANNVIRMFINGVSAATPVTYSASLNQSSSGTPSISIGSRVTDGNISELFTGYISNVRVIAGNALYTSSFIPPTQPVTPVQGTQLLVNGTNSALFDATSRNAIETVGNAKVSTKTAQWGTNTSLYFDGTGDSIKVINLDTVTLDTSNFTIEFWVYFNNVTTQQTIISKGWPEQAYASYLILLENQILKVYLGTAGTSWDIANARAIGTMTAQTWTHVALTRDGSTFKAFVNGQINSSFTFTSIGRLLNNNPRPLYIGGISSGAHSLNGYLQDVRITKETARYTASFALPEAKFGIK
jgi:hypothetical protein